jgi:transcriptional antiterminator NusG
MTDSKKVVCCSCSGQENKESYIENEISRLEMDYVSQVLVRRKVVTVKDGKKLIKDKVYFPGMS